MINSSLIHDSQKFEFRKRWRKPSFRCYWLFCLSLRRYLLDVHFLIQLWVLTTQAGHAGATHFSWNKICRKFLDCPMFRYKNLKSVANFFWRLLSFRFSRYVDCGRYFRVVLGLIYLVQHCLLTEIHLPTMPLSIFTETELKLVFEVVFLGPQQLLG